MSSNNKPVNFTRKYREFPFATRHNAVTDEYDVSKESLGVGINGKVLTCWHRETKRKCALKTIKDSDKARREVILQKKASEDCKYIVQILDVYENTFASNRCLLVVMECMEGGELFNRIRDRHDKPYTEREAANIVLMIANAVAHLHHMDIAHRDLKPENLLFTSAADDAILKLTDFGFAKEGNNERCPFYTPCISEFYVAPEILSNDKYDKACDIWSMGVIVYILLCGYPPFYSTNSGTTSAGIRTKIKAGEYQFPEADWENVSHDAKSVIRKMLTVDPVARCTIDWILQCPWLIGTVPETPIDMRILGSENYEPMRIESEFDGSSFDLLYGYSLIVTAATEAQRRDDEVDINLLGPDRSRVAQRAAKRQQQTVTESLSLPFSKIKERI